MDDSTTTPSSHARPSWVAAVARAEPRAPWMVPYLAYLLLMMVVSAVPAAYQPVAMGLHLIAALVIVWLFRPHLPDFGKPHWPLALVVGVAAACLWAAGQHVLNGVHLGGYGLGGRFPLYPGVAKTYNPHVDFGDGPAFWFYVTMKIARACTAVPVVEELFWRGFLLRALVSWDRFDDVAWGRLSWRAMIGTALLSVVQHPDNWGVSIACWLLFNALFYWKRSLSCLFITHAATNLSLYGYVVCRGDWQFW